MFFLDNMKRSVCEKRFCGLYRFAGLVDIINSKAKTHVFVNLSETLAPPIQSSRIELERDSHREKSYEER